jgi:hypothetical protein
MHREFKGSAIDLDAVRRTKVGGPGRFEAEQHSGEESVQGRAGGVGEFELIQPEYGDGPENGWDLPPAQLAKRVNRTRNRRRQFGAIDEA